MCYIRILLEKGNLFRKNKSWLKPKPFSGSYWFGCHPPKPAIPDMCLSNPYRAHPHVGGGGKCGVALLQGKQQEVFCLRQNASWSSQVHRDSMPIATLLYRVQLAPTADSWGYDPVSSLPILGAHIPLWGVFREKSLCSFEIRGCTCDWHICRLQKGEKLKTLHSLHPTVLQKGQVWSDTHGVLKTHTFSFHKIKDAKVFPVKDFTKDHIIAAVVKLHICIMVYLIMVCGIKLSSKVSGDWGCIKCEIIARSTFNSIVMVWEGSKDKKPFSVAGDVPNSFLLMVRPILTKNGVKERLPYLCNEVACVNLAKICNQS